MLSISSDKLMSPPGLTLQSSEGKLPMLEEHVERGGGPTRLVAGKDFTRWTGLAVAIDAKRVLVAAGSRGLLTADLGLGGPVKTIDLGAEVTDVFAHDALVYAIAGRDLVRLDAKTLAPVGRITLPSKFERFVR
jgi:hypothetical protein